MEKRLRCDICGQFISNADIKQGRALRQMVTPDSQFTHEDYETLCEKCWTVQKCKGDSACIVDALT